MTIACFLLWSASGWAVRSDPRVRLDLTLLSLPTRLLEETAWQNGPPVFRTRDIVRLHEAGKSTVETSGRIVIENRKTGVWKPPGEVEITLKATPNVGPDGYTMVMPVDVEWTINGVREQLSASIIMWDGTAQSIGLMHRDDSTQCRFLIIRLTLLDAKGKTYHSDTDVRYRLKRPEEWIAEEPALKKTFIDLVGGPS
ncbi:MAG: hypothetical protein AAF492_18305, partial [Verrucomicrobiota bacterium]